MEWWQSTPKSVRVVVRVFVPLGVALMSLGLYGDCHGWWDNRGFATNLFSSLAGLLVGVPFALLALSKLAEDQADAAARRACASHARKTAASFAATLRTGLVESDPARIDATLDALRAGSRAVKKDLDHNEHLPEDGSALDTLRQDLRTDLNDWATARGQALTKARNDLRPWIRQILQNWARLDNDIRPRLEELGLRWLPPAAHTTLSESAKTLEKLEFSTQLRFQFAEAAVRTPSAHDDEAWTLHRTLVAADAEAEHQLAKALKTIMKTLPDIEQIGHTH
ncbi:hypothetical protein [Streptomyces xantholiticus]|uniref:hypothetical protein n=1 Tax=Streptomyces xantholiticus TaxID=68285 RepID=UPI0016731A83|nr:hypothetical protein [Streptomyces xantholiticus]GGW69904.1 hypothetical protein GCM10010381_63400 [Streptomyces xantholiticus]